MNEWPKRTSEEKSLVPETLDRIMSKTQDINRPGIGYSLVDTDALESIFKNGILGADLRKNRDERSTGPESWNELMREDSPADIYFNITDRSYVQSYDYANSKSIIGRSYFMSTENSCAILFDISSLKEIEHDIAVEKTAKHRRGKYFIDSSPSSPDYRFRVTSKKNVEGKNLIETEHGFRLSNRVAPRKFTGIVFKGSGIKLKEIVSLMVKVLGPEVLFPIYNGNGDLIWPKKVPYEEVKHLGTDTK